MVRHPPNVQHRESLEYVKRFLKKLEESFASSACKAAIPPRLFTRQSNCYEGRREMAGGLLRGEQLKLISSDSTTATTELNWCKSKQYFCLSD